MPTPEEQRQKRKEHNKKYYQQNRQMVLELVSKRTFCEVCEKTITHYARHIKQKRHLFRAQVKSGSDTIEI